MVAAVKGHANVVDTLLQHGASVDMKKKVNAQLTVSYTVAVTFSSYGILC